MYARMYYVSVYVSMYHMCECLCMYYVLWTSLSVRLRRRLRL